jgi:hypothetical protein
MGSFTFTAAKDNKSYTDVIVGRSPFLRSKTLTPVDVMIVPLIITIGTTTFDPTITDTCISTVTSSDLLLFQNSPIFNNVTFDGSGAAGHASMMNGVNVGTTNYISATRVGEFYSHVGGTSYGVSFNVTTHAAVTTTATAIGGGSTANPVGTFSGQTCPLGVLNINNVDTFLQGQLTSLGIPATTFAIFLMKNIVMSNDGSNSNGCCVLGYHGATGSPIQTYSPMDFDTEGAFGSGAMDISVPAHEIAEWVDDPLGTNPTPRWGNIGQVGTCSANSGGQTNWENGDPVTGHLYPGILMSNGFTYHPQEIAFWGWFYDGFSGGAAVPIAVNGANVAGAGGKFSTNGTFGGPSKICKNGSGSGGTN